MSLTNNPTMHTFSVSLRREQQINETCRDKQRFEAWLNT